MDESLQQIFRNIEQQIAREKARAAQRTPSGDRRLGPGQPPAGQTERRSGQDRRRPRD